MTKTTQTGNFQLSRLKRANVPYLASEVHSILSEAPGAPKPPPPRKPRRNSKLELADAEISACKWCGIWTVKCSLLTLRRTRLPNYRRHPGDSMTTKPALKPPNFQFKTADELGPHVTQVAVDGHGEYVVFSNARPLQVATKLREIAAHIEEMEEDS